MAYPVRLAAVLSGVSPRRLRNWARPCGEQPALLTPEHASSRPALWSLRDVVALRTFVYLVGAGRSPRISLQRIRRAVESLPSVTGDGHPSRYRLEAAGATVAWVPDDGDPADPVTRLGQRPPRVLLSDVLGPFEDAAGREVPALLRPRVNLRVQEAVQGGYPVIVGTRVPYDLVAGLVADGVLPSRVRDYYPSVTEEGVADAVDLARQVDGTGGADRQPVAA